MSNIYNLSNITGFDNLLKSDLDSNLNVLKLNKIESRTNNSNYKVIRYDKNFLSSDLIPTYGLCRSVIVNCNNKVIGFSPPKSMSFDSFMAKHENLLDANITVQEFVEGTMINVFFDPDVGLTGSWEIATRNTVGATSTFFKGPNAKSFRQMFMEAVEHCKLNLNDLDKRLSYSFVLQHPENRIVVPFSEPKLYLVGVYEILNVENNIIVKSYSWEDYLHFFQDELKCDVKFPQLYSHQNYSDIINTYGSMNTNYDIVGAVIYNEKTGERTKIRNPVYEQVRNLRGNQPKLQYQYLCLRKEGKVKDFLKFYPENKNEFSKFRDQVHLFTDTLYLNYVSCYIKKEKPLIEFSDQYRTHMFNIHQIYMNELREKKQYINNTVVQKYVNELHPSLLMYCLNHHMRKRNLDKIITDKQ